ncbi:hypothetical protein [Sphingobacterium sp. CZ-2]|uniref:hypothetical protein n=1 Tax=Sphingobacterium sp. CZ-2 TaxID=2557994 RepID=UPI00106F0B0B|nr:hypothetical protein [Sphingobacterium sp. CZ-2]QBR13623.1 hypothetical protein E3D81_16120 [Sphingobacterium sp. CZ-2]
MVSDSILRPEESLISRMIDGSWTRCARSIRNLMERYLTMDLPISSSFNPLPSRSAPSGRSSLIVPLKPEIWEALTFRSSELMPGPILSSLGTIIRGASIGVWAWQYMMVQKKGISRLSKRLIVLLGSIT